MAITNLGPMPATLERDNEGHRTYTVSYKLTSDNYLDGPANVVQAFDIAYPVGSYWNIGTDVDIWAFRLFTTKVTFRGSDDGEKTKHWTVEATFSTKNPKRCNDTTIENPLLEPAKVSGGYKTDREEAWQDRFGKPITNSAHELLKGSTIEFDKSRMAVRIEQNVASSYLAYELPYQMRDCVNQFPLWGFNPRCVKLGSSPWERKYFGTCFPYYQRTLEFELDPEGFDRNILDEGTKVLHGHWGGTFRRQGTITSGSALVTGIVSTANLLDAQVSGTGIPTGTTVRTVNSATTLTLSANATASGTVSLTYTQDNWILDDINGAAPNPGNPQHFDLYRDRTGNPTHVQLNGAGLPANVVIGSRDIAYYMYVLGITVAVPITNTNVWIRIPISPPGSSFDIRSTVTDWLSNRFYSRGSLVFDGVNTYICIIDLSVSEAPALFPNSWLRITPQDRGEWDPSFVGYAAGDYVQVLPRENLTKAGSVVIQKYNEADFLLLGIPTTF